MIEEFRLVVHNSIMHVWLFTYNFLCVRYSWVFTCGNTALGRAKGYLGSECCRKHTGIALMGMTIAAARACISGCVDLCVWITTETFLALSWVWSSSAGDLQTTMVSNSGSQGVQNCTNLREEKELFFLKACCSVTLKTMKVSVQKRLICFAENIDWTR